MSLGTGTGGNGTYNLSANATANLTAGTVQGGSPIDGGNWIDFGTLNVSNFNPFASILGAAGSRYLNLNCGNVGDYNLHLLKFNALANTSCQGLAQRIVFQILPGSISSQIVAVGMGIPASQSGAQSFVMFECGPGVNENASAVQIYDLNPRNGLNYRSSASSTAQTGSTFVPNASDYYVIEMIQVGSYPIQYTMNIYNMGTGGVGTSGTSWTDTYIGTSAALVSTSAILTGGSGAAVNSWSPTQPTSIVGNTDLQNDVNTTVCFTDLNSSGAIQISNIAIYTDTSTIQPATLEIVSNTGTAVSFRTHLYSDGLTARYGSGSYAYYMHRSTLGNYVPAHNDDNGTTIRVLNSGNPISISNTTYFTDTTGVTGTSYYYVLETYDTVNQTSSFTWLGNVASVTAKALTTWPPTSGNAAIIQFNGHSYVAGTGASTAGTTGFANVATQMLLSGSLDGNALTGTASSNTAVAGSTMVDADTGAYHLRTAAQNATMVGANAICCMYSTNDCLLSGSPDYTTAQVQAWWTNYLTYMKTNAPTVKFVLIVAAPPTINSTQKFGMSNAQFYALIQEGMADAQYTFVCGQDLLALFNAYQQSAKAGYWADESIAGCSISGYTLTTPSNSNIAIGQLVTGTGVTANSIITAGSGTSWTLSQSSTVSSEAMTFNGWVNSGATLPTNGAPNSNVFTDTWAPISGEKASIGGVPNSNADYVHPNDWGHYIIACSVAAGILHARLYQAKTANLGQGSLPTLRAEGAYAAYCTFGG
jgi:lysophospholipase L1-like esterase